VLIFFFQGYGYARRPDDEDPTEAMHMAPDTIIDTGGLSVPFTAAAVAKLVDDEERYPEVHWETPVRRLLDEFWLKSHNGTNYTREVTLEDILSHRSGLPR
jgi:CubicO group peptidase (beta-lactamase class C family)